MKQNVLLFWIIGWISWLFILPVNSSVNYLTNNAHQLMDSMGRYRIINDRQDKEPYLERYYLFLKDREWFPFNIFLHKFLKSDPDDLHDHPWPYCTIILRGGYWEHTPKIIDDKTGEIKETGRKWWGAGSIRCASSNQLHRIELDENDLAEKKYPWTLFMPGMKIRDWGFKTKNGWIPNQQYLENKKTN